MKFIQNLVLFLFAWISNHKSCVLYKITNKVITERSDVRYRNALVKLASQTVMDVEMSLLGDLV